MRRLSCGLLLLAGCASETTAPTVLSLRLVPAPSTGFFSASDAPSGVPLFSAGQAVVGQPLAVALQVIDQNNTPVPGISVRWSVLRASGSADATATVSDTGGIVRMNWTLDTTAKLDSMQASLTQGTGAIVTASGVHSAAAAAQKVSGDAQTVAPGATAAPLVLRVADGFGNPVGNMFVAWDVIAGDCNLSQITSRTDANGTAQVTVTVGGAPGDCRVLATLGVVPAVIFALKAQ
jgi:protocatechuate 3,4-dioxygenase beta subunit